MARWRLSLTWRTLRWVPPLLFQCAAVAIVCASGGQPLDSTLAETAVVSLFGGAWFGAAHAGAERPAHTESIDVAIGPRRRLRGTSLAALPYLLVGAVVAVVGPLLTGRPGDDRTVAAVVTALLAQLAVAGVGYAIGTVAHRAGRGNRGWVVVATLVACTLVLARPSNGVGPLTVLLPPVTGSARTTVGAEAAGGIAWCAAWTIAAIEVVAFTIRPSRLLDRLAR